mmetsp:Transcript_10869/g.14937  ORF Transcript_10869/g.14937 Transcript_10869/m.14937 type:complete len:251 (+) Transcript_10869:88-840(+)
MFYCAVVFVLKKKKRQAEGNQSANASNVELHPRKSSISHYAPISSHYDVGLTNESDEWNIPYQELKLVSEIGRGAFGVVFKGTWKGQSVAVKQARVDDANLKTSFHMQDFFAEAEVMKKLKPHPNVTRLLGVCPQPGCIVLEYVDNGTLSDFLSDSKSVDVQTQISIARGIAEGMLYLHNEGIIHRDLAARNILLTQDLIPKVSDFGMSRQILDEKNTNKTSPIRWMAPEAMKERVYNRKTDVWSYGAVL